MRRPHVLAATVVLLAPLASARAEVLVVQPGGPAGTFPTIADAVNAAIDGDVVLVRTGSYVTFFIHDKAISVVAQAGAGVQLSACARVVGLSAGKTVVLSGLTLMGTTTASPLFAGTGLTLLDNLGAVRVEDCTLFGAHNVQMPVDCEGPNGGRGWSAAQISGCADVVFTGCTFLGGMGLDQGFEIPFTCTEYASGGDGGHGAEVHGSTVAWFDCHLIAGPGGPGGWGGNGGHGLSVVGGSAFVSGGTLGGNAGGQGWDFAGGDGGDGGHGASFIAASSAGVALDEAFGGPGGHGFGGQLSPSGQALFGGPDTLHAGPARGLGFPVPVTGGSAFSAAFGGAPLDLALLVLGSSALHVHVPALSGVLLAGGPILVGSVALDGNGKGALLVSTPALPPAQGLAVLLQSAFVTTAGELRLGAARPQVLVSASP